MVLGPRKWPKIPKESLGPRRKFCQLAARSPTQFSYAVGSAQVHAQTPLTAGRCSRYPKGIVDGTVPRSERPRAAISTYFARPAGPFALTCLLCGEGKSTRQMGHLALRLLRQLRKRVWMRAAGMSYFLPASKVRLLANGSSNGTLRCPSRSPCPSVDASCKILRPSRLQ